MNINLSLIVQAVTFALLIWFTVKVIWPYLLRTIETRQKTIADGLAAAEEGKRSLELASRTSDEEIRKARGRAAEVLSHAEKRAAQLIEEAKNAAKEEGNREKAAAKAEIEQEMTRAREQLRDQVASLAVAGAEKILRREVDARAHGELLESLKRQLEWPSRAT
jgi:F-type H+-transporting ATPase subunit b